MNIHCHTNLDLNYNEKWPETLPCRPMEGDIITSSTGLELQVVKVRFDYKGNCNVELHLRPNQSIKDFEDWYQKRF